jgi:hypothetical protein
MSKQPIITRRLGRQSDLAKELEISDSAVSQLVRRYKIPKDLQGLLDLDYARWMIREKGNAKRQESQRNKAKPAPRPESWNIRQFIESLAGIWDQSITETISQHAEFMDKDDVISVSFSLWQAFHAHVDRELLPQAEILSAGGDNQQWPMPPTLDRYFAESERQMFEHIEAGHATDEQV